MALAKPWKMRKIPYMRKKFKNIIKNSCCHYFVSQIDRPIQGSKAYAFVLQHIFWND